MSSTKHITRLTAAGEEARFQQFVTKWAAIARSTQPANRERAERAICRLYKLAKLPEPRVIWLPCPLSDALSALLGGRS